MCTKGKEDPRIRNLTKTMMLCAADDEYRAGLAGQPGQPGQPGLVGLAGQTVLTGPTALPDPMYEFAANFVLPKRRISGAYIVDPTGTNEPGVRPTIGLRGHLLHEKQRTPF